MRKMVVAAAIAVGVAGAVAGVTAADVWVQPERVSADDTHPGTGFSDPGGGGNDKDGGGGGSHTDTMSF
jgi:hypothetical protein